MILAEALEGTAAFLIISGFSCIKNDHFVRSRVFIFIGGSRGSSGGTIVLDEATGVAGGGGCCS